MFSSFLGGGSTQHFYYPPPSDHAYAVAIDGTGNVYVSGDTAAPDFPTRHAFQRSIAGGSDGFVAKISSPKGSPSRYHKSCVAPVDFDPYQSHDVGSRPASVAIGDVTGDGLNDALMTTSSYRPGPADHKLFVFPQQPDGSLGPPTAYPFYGTYGATYQFG